MDEGTRKLIKKVLGDPQSLREVVPEFLTFLQQTIQTNQNLSLDGYQIDPGAIKDRNVALDARIGRYKIAARVLAAGLGSGTINLDKATLGEDPDFFLAVGSGDTIVLPKVDLWPGKMLTIKNAGGNPIAVQPFSGDDIDGDTGNFNIDNLGDFIEVTSGARTVSDGTTTWYATNTIPVFGNNIEVSRGAAPPGSPKEGDFWLCQTTITIHSSGSFTPNWLFRYDPSEATNKWIFVGGAPCVDIIDTDQTFTANTTWQDATTVGPLITMPFAGDYIVSGSASLYSSTIVPVKTFYVGAAIGATSPDVRVYAGVANSGSGADCHPFFMGSRSYAQNDAVRLRYFSVTDATASHARNREIKVWPVKINA